LKAPTVTFFLSDKSRIYGVAHRDMVPEVIHNSAQYASNKAELSHQPPPVCGRGRCVDSNRPNRRRAAYYTLFSLDRYLIGAGHYWKLTVGAFSDWKVAAA